MDPLIGGLLAALGISVISFVFAQGVAVKLRRSGQSVIAESMAGTTVRLLLTALGVLGVFLVFGRSWGICCALGTIPLYGVELIGSVFLLLRSGKIPPKRS